jgi:hypothetical protein
MSRSAHLATIVVAAMAALAPIGTAVAQAASPSPAANVAAASSTAPGPAPQVIGGGVDVPLQAGTVRFEFPLMAAVAKPIPDVLVDVPDGWTSFKGFALHGPRETAISFWNVEDVYSHPCYSKDVMIHPGPTVDDLANVLATRPMRDATAPVPVTLGGYDGKYLQWSVPTDIVLEDCDEGYFDSWTGNGTGGTGRYQQGPGQVDRLWILDVAGQRFVIDAFYMPDANEQDKTTLQQVVDSIRFEQ